MHFCIRMKLHNLGVLCSYKILLYCVLLRSQEFIIHKFNAVLMLCSYSHSHFTLKRTYQMNGSKRPAISGQNKYFELRILTRSQHNFVLIYVFVCKHWKIKDSKHKQITIICPTKDDSLHGNFFWTQNIWSLGNILILSALRKIWTRSSLVWGCGIFGVFQPS